MCIRDRNTRYEFEPNRLSRFWVIKPETYRHTYIHTDIQTSYYFRVRIVHWFSTLLNLSCIIISFGPYLDYLVSITNTLHKTSNLKLFGLDCMPKSSFLEPSSKIKAKLLCEKFKIQCVCFFFMRTKVNANFTYLYFIEIDHLYLIFFIMLGHFINF